MTTDMAGDLRDAAGLMAFADTVGNADVRREMRDRAVGLFWNAIESGRPSARETAPARVNRFGLE